MKTTKLSNSVLAYSLTLLVGGVPTAQAAPGTLSDQPLFLVNNVAPNVLFLHDDSASMQFELLTSGYGAEGILKAGMDGLEPALVDNNTNLCPVVLGNYERVFQPDITSCSITVAEEEWRARLHNINKIYYNPEIEYKPWAGTDSNGNAFAKITDITAAPIDPTDPTGSTIDLTSDSAVLVPNSDYTSSARTYYQHADWKSWCTNNEINTNTLNDIQNEGECVGWRYYTWDDDNGDETIQATDGDETIQAAELTIHWVKDLTTDQKINFATWFTYHRSREYAAKYAISNVINDASNSRMGFATINDSNQAHWVEIQDANSNKNTLLNALRDTDATTISTPLVTALEGAGEYYKSANFFGNGSAKDPILSAPAGACQANNTILITDGYYSDGSATDTLASVADTYYNTDFKPGANYDDDQRMNTYGVAFGVEGSIDPSNPDIHDATFSWPDPTTSDAAKIDDLLHATVNGYGDFLSANNSDELTTALSSALKKITDDVQSATSVTTSSFQLDNGEKIFFSLFNSIDWSGDLLAKDVKIKTDGSISITDAWSAADELDNEGTSFYDSREIITFNGSTGAPFRWDDISTDMQNALTAGSTITDMGKDRLNYLRGEQSDGTFRERNSLLGDIVNSSAVYVGAPAGSYPNSAPFGATGDRYFGFWQSKKDRNAVIYVGANDGMLHGFDTGTGEEVLAYVPETVFPNLHELTDPGYSHRFFVDQSPSVADAYFAKGGTGSQAWRTILAGGLGAGGRGIYALDITDPTNFYENSASSVALWEFNADDDEDLGYTFSRPVIALTNNGWAAIVGNGYNSSDGNSDNATASLFILYLDADVSDGWNLGSDYIKIDTGVGGTDTAQNGLSSATAVDTDGDGYVDRAYAGDLEGNMWAFDLSASDDANWDVAYDDSGTALPLFNASVSGTAQPITAKPTIIRHPDYTTISSNNPNLLVLFGTGQYVTTDDLNNTDTQAFYSVWDKGQAQDQNGNNLSRANLVEQTITTGTDSATGITARRTSSNAIPYGDPSDTKRFGWYMDLGPDADSSGERVVTNAVVFNDVAFFTTYIPNSTDCDKGGTSWYMFVNATDGSYPDSPVVSINGDWTVDDDDNVTLNKTKTAPSGMLVDGTLGPPALGLSGDDGPDVTMMNTENGLQNLATDLGSSVLGQRISWRELRND